MRCKAGLAKPVDEVNESVKMVTHTLIGVKLGIWVKLGVWVNLVLSKLRFLATMGFRKHRFSDKFSGDACCSFI